MIFRRIQTKFTTLPLSWWARQSSIEELRVKTRSCLLKELIQLNIQLISWDPDVRNPQSPRVLHMSWQSLSYSSAWNTSHAVCQWHAKPKLSGKPVTIGMHDTLNFKSIDFYTTADVCDSDTHEVQCNTQFNAGNSPLWQAPPQQNLTIEKVSNLMSSVWVLTTFICLNKTLAVTILLWQNLPYKVHGPSNGLVQPKSASLDRCEGQWQWQIRPRQWLAGQASVNAKLLKRNK